jgi:hypothetical protein
MAAAAGGKIPASSRPTGSFPLQLAGQFFIQRYLRSRSWAKTVTAALFRT